MKVERARIEKIVQIVAKKLARSIAEEFAEEFVRKVYDVLCPDGYGCGDEDEPVCREPDEAVEAVEKAKAVRATVDVQKVVNAIVEFLKRNNIEVG
jgi:uncharacterized protein (DUF2267 family)